MRLILLLLTAAVAVPAAAATPAEMLRDRALAGSPAYAILESLTTEIGPRLAATPAEARARDWAVARLKALGFQKVETELFDVPHWERGIATAEVVAPAPQRLMLTAPGI